VFEKVFDSELNIGVQVVNEVIRIKWLGSIDLGNIIEQLYTFFLIELSNIGRWFNYKEPT